MKPIEIIDVVKACKASGEEVFNGIITGVSTDSRVIKPGELFIPLKGEKFDGHNFIQDAFFKGAAASLCNSKYKVLDSRYKDKIIYVKDTNQALLDLASYYRGLFDATFIAITGSVGKTTTKEMVASVLKKRFCVLKTEGNFNNEIGLPLTLFQLEDCHKLAVIEMGMSGLGEIRQLVNIVKPSISIITNIGISHIEKLGSRQNIAKAKLEILEPLGKDDLAVLNAESPELWSKKEHISPKTIYFGHQKGDIRVSNVKTERENVTFEIKGKYGNHIFNIPILGTHNVMNALPAVALGFEMGLSKQDIYEGLMEFRPTKMRLELKKASFGATLIDDSYNASPDSMKAALDVLRQMGEGKRKAAIIGDMLELGEYANETHRHIGEYAADKTDILIAVGNFAREIISGARDKGMDERDLYMFKSTKEAIGNVKNLVKKSDIILIKASRGLKMEQITQHLAGRVLID